MNLLSRLKSEGVLLLHHDYRTGTFQDFSGNGKHGVPSGCYLSKDGAKFNAGTEVISCGADSIGTGACSILSLFRPTDYGGGSDGRLFSNVSGGNGVGLWISDTNDRVSFVGDGSTQANSANDSLTIGGWRTAAVTRNAAGDNTDLYVDGAPSGTLAQDSGTPSAGGTMYVGNRAAFDRGFRGTIAVTIVVSRELTPAEIAELETEVRTGVPDTKEVITEIDSSLVRRATHLGPGARVTTSNVTAGQIPGTPFWVGSGAFSVGVETVNGKLAKVLTCQVAGVVYAKWGDLRNNPSEAAYGTWEFWALKPDTTLQNISFMTTKPGVFSVPGQNGYLIQVTPTEAIYLYKITAAAASQLYRTATGSASVGAYDCHKVTRSPTGEFSHYLNGTLLATLAGTNPITDNTHTTSNYFVAEIDAGDKIALAHLDGQPLFSKYLGVV